MFGDSDIEIVGNEMVLDMDNFDFNAIDSEEAAEEVAEETVEEVEEDVSDLVEEESETEEEVEEDNEEDSTEETEETADAGGDEEVDYDSYELTLPTGENVVLAELVKGYREAKALEEERTQFDSIRSEFELKTKDLTHALELASLEADRVIDDYSDFDWATLAKEDPAAYVENREFLDKYKQRRQEITKEMEAIRERKEADEKRDFENKAREANAQLIRDIPGWSGDLYSKLCEYAVSEKGYDADFIKNCINPNIFKTLHSLLTYEKGVQKVTAKVKRVGSPQKVVKPAAKETKPAVDAKKIAVLKKIEKGDVSDAFDFLED